MLCSVFIYIVVSLMQLCHGQSQARPEKRGGLGNGLAAHPGKPYIAKEKAKSQKAIKQKDESSPPQVLMKSAILDAKTATKIGRWNVQKLYQSGKLAQVFREFANYKIDILGLSEMKWTGSGRLKSKNMTLLYSGHEQHT